MPPASDPSVRSRGPLSCAECRRLKLKCDRQKPCSSCRKRGCASICPQGHMVAKGSRFILANTEQLHDKIDALVHRVRELEEALETSHAIHSTELHPLLQEELRLTGKPMDTTLSMPEPLGKEDELVDSMGTLTLEGRGSRYFGSTATFANLWNEGEAPDGPGVKHRGDAALALSEFPPEIAHMAHSFPIRLPSGSAADLSAWIVENCLPPFTEAWSLFENYWEHYAWHLTPFTRATFVEQILSPFYHHTPANADKPLGHRLALLFVVFAIGEYMDLTQPFGPSNGLRYYLLARASLCLDPVFESPTVTALQAMHLLVMYLLKTGGTYEPENAWILAGINIKLALTLGLQHDPSNFHLPAAEVEARQHVIVAIICEEVWQSLAVGRPTSCTFANFDWAFAKPPDKNTPDPLASTRYWIAVFMRDCVAKTSETLVSKRATSYSAVMKLDTKIREYPLPVEASDVSEDRAEDESIGKRMQRTAYGGLKDSCLLFLHRRFFFLALRDYPEDPLGSPFAPSVTACHTNATTISARARNFYSVAPAMARRVWFIWPNLFVSTLMLGSIVARSPGCPLASSALLELERLCQFWEMTSSENVCSPKVLSKIRELKQRALVALGRKQAPKDPHNANSSGIEISADMRALGGDEPGMISFTSKPSSSPSFAPSLREQGTEFNPTESLSSSNVPEAYAVSPASGEHGYLLGSLSAAAAFHDPQFSFMASPFDFSSIDSSYRIPDYPSDPLSSDFNEIFRTLATGPSRTFEAVPTVLEELGLGGEWQPDMDDLGL